MALRALVGAQVFDGHTLHKNKAVVISGASAQIAPLADLPHDYIVDRLQGGVVMPGFVDLQVNGGGGVMLNDDPSVQTLETIATAHAGLGTRAFLPTLITDTPEMTQSAITAVTQAIKHGVPGIVGLHLEGPYLDPVRKGAHDGALIRTMTPQDERVLLDAARSLPNLMITVAPENVTMAQIKTLSRAGIIVSLGHSDTDYDTAMRAFDAGARCVTHLFNAMSQLGSRTPGLVGAALNAPAVSAGLIADGIHVHPATIRAALAAHTGPGEVFLVTDAMACAGSDLDRFVLNGRDIRRADGRLTLADGTLAGADLTMARAVQTMVQDAGDDLSTALARATSIPAGLLCDPCGAGRWSETVDDLIYLSDGYDMMALQDFL